MEAEKHSWRWGIRAGEDLGNFTPGTGALFKAVALKDGKFANNGREAGGILVYGGRMSENVTIGYAGEIKFTAGDAVKAGQQLTVVTSGYFAVAGPGNHVVGRCLDTAVSSGSVGTGAFNFATIPFMGDSGELY